MMRRTGCRAPARRTKLGRRTFLATMTAFLSSPRAVLADDEFPAHFIGANTAIEGYGLFECIDLLRRLGFRTIEVQDLDGVPEPTPGRYPGFRLHEADEELRARVREALQGFDCVTTHLPYWGLEYFSSEDKEARHGIETMERALETTAFLGAKIGVVHPKPGPGMSLKQTWPLMIRRFRRWGDLAKASGFRLALETGYPLSVEDFVRLVYEVDHDSVGATIDVGHQGRYQELVDRVNPEARGTPEGIRAYNDINMELVERLGEKLIHFHIHDIEPDTWVEHKPLIYGFIDYPRLLAQLREIRYQGLLVFEIGGPPAEMPGYLADAKRIMDRYVQVVQQPDA